MKAVLHSDTCGCRLIATPGFLTCAGEQPRSALGQSRPIRQARAESGLPSTTDLGETSWHVSFVPTTEVQVGLLATCFLASG